MDSVLEHLIIPLEYLKELNKILKPGGVVYIGVPNEDSLLNDFRKIVFRITGKGELSEKIKPFEPSYHVAGFTKKSLRIAAWKANLKILDIINFAARFEFMKYPLFTRGFLVHFLTLPIDLAAIILKREAYLEAYMTK
jgi:SAM-dependent methyltransferase